MALYDIDAGNKDYLFLWENAVDFPSLALVFSSDDHHCIFFPYLHFKHSLLLVKGLNAFDLPGNHYYAQPISAGLSNLRT